MNEYNYLYLYSITNNNNNNNYLLNQSPWKSFQFKNCIDVVLSWTQVIPHFDWKVDQEIFGLDFDEYISDCAFVRDFVFFVYP